MQAEILMDLMLASTKQLGTSAKSHAAAAAAALGLCGSAF